MLYGEGISKEGAILDLAVEKKLIQKSGAWYNYGEMRIGQGRDNTRIFLKDNPELTQKLEKQLRAMFEAGAQAGRSGSGSQAQGQPERDGSRGSRAGRRRKKITQINTIKPRGILRLEGVLCCRLRLLRGVKRHIRCPRREPYVALRAGNQAADVKIPRRAGDVDDLYDIEIPERRLVKRNGQHGENDPKNHNGRKRDDQILRAAKQRVAARVGVEPRIPVVRLSAGKRLHKHAVDDLVQHHIEQIPASIISTPSTV